MTRTELLELVRNGENSHTEFKEDAVSAEKLAREMSALLNFEGGHIVLGVEDRTGSIVGLSRDREQTEEWVMNVARDRIRPGFIPSWQCIEIDDGKLVGIIGVSPDSPDKPYKARLKGSWATFVRVGTTTREATREEEGRLYQSARVMRYDIRPVLGTSGPDLDLLLLDNYLRVVQGLADVPDMEDAQGWERLLLNLDILVDSQGASLPTVAGLLLFGHNPNRRLPQAGITAAAFKTDDKDYDTEDEELIRGPLVPRLAEERLSPQQLAARRISPRRMLQGRIIVEPGVIDRAVDFVQRNMGVDAWLEGARRVRKGAFPLDAVREAVVNAVAHRDYTLATTDIELSLYSDRMEVVSPGRLPNGVTVAKMAEGVRAARNELVKEILRDYGYVDHQGMGVRKRIIGSMRAHNGTEPDLIENDSRFTVRLWK